MPISAAPPSLEPVSSTARFLIVDGHAYAYRAFYAIRQLSSPSGAPTNAIYGFIKMLAKMRASHQPTHWAVVWDGGLAAERLTSLPEYKAQRPPMPADLERQIEQIQSYLEAASVPSICHDGVEADDLIATLTRQAVADGASVVIASSDKDFMQLVSPRVGLLNPNDKSEAIWTAEQVSAKTGVNPEQIVDWLSLIGDSVDNISGVAGVGPKTAAELINQHGSTAEIYRNLPAVSSERLRTNLMAAQNAVERNRSLIRLKDDLPGADPMDRLEMRPVDYDRLREMYLEWGFKTLLQELETEIPSQRDLF